jgi:hypothetical protein
MPSRQFLIYQEALFARDDSVWAAIVRKDYEENKPPEYADPEEMTERLRLAFSQ